MSFVVYSFMGTCNFLSFILNGSLADMMPSFILFHEKVRYIYASFLFQVNRLEMFCIPDSKIEEIIGWNIRLLPRPCFPTTMSTICMAPQQPRFQGLILLNLLRIIQLKNDH